VNWSPLDFGLAMPLTVALTLTVATTCGGDSIVQDVLELQLTEVAFGEPNLKIVAAPSAKPDPVTVTLVPPAVPPELGFTDVTLGVYLK
jgi:hypothetical protein